MVTKLAGVIRWNHGHLHSDQQGVNTTGDPLCRVTGAHGKAPKAYGKPFAVCRTRQSARHVHTANFFQYFISNFQTFSFQFFSFSLVFYLMFKTLSHFLITSLKVTGQFMFYLDIAIISCVANKYLISKKNYKYTTYPKINQNLALKNLCCFLQTQKLLKSTANS